MPSCYCFHAFVYVLSASIFAYAANIPVEIRETEVSSKMRVSEQTWKPQKTRFLDSLPAEATSTIPLDRFGGVDPDPARATGFFHTQRIDGRWQLIDPEGGRFVAVGVNSVNAWNTQNGREAAKAKFGDERQWMQGTIALLKANGFNCTGAWSDTTLLRQAEPRIVYTRNLDFMSGYGKKRGGAVQAVGHMAYPESCIFVFDPGFEAYCEEQAAKLDKQKDDPWLLGYFSDNELPFVKDALDRYLKLPAEEPGCVFAKSWLAQKGGEINDQTRADFLAEVLERYFRITTSAIRKYAPNHLCLGSRFYGPDRKNSAVWTVAGKYLDVVSINYYGTWTPSVELMANWSEWAQKPFLVTEFYVKGMDAGLGNTSGAGWCVQTQRDRGLFYQNFTLSLLEAKGCVGWQWFKYSDNDPANTKTDLSNRDANKGIVSAQFEPYQPLLAAMRDLNLRVYSLLKK